MSNRLDQFREADFEQMREVQKAIVGACLPFLRGRTHPLLVILALARCMRVVFRKCDKPDREQLYPVINAYMRGDTEVPNDPVGSRIITLQ